MGKTINPYGKKIIKVETEFCGQTLSLEINRVGFRTSASVLVRYGETVILGTAMIGQPLKGFDYFPLSIDYEEKFYGDTTLRLALIDSRNIPTIKIVQDIKVATVIDEAKRLGLDGPFNADLSISLGSANASVQDMVHAFTAFPLQGKSFHPVMFDKILDRDGRVLETSEETPLAAASPTPTTSQSPEAAKKEEEKKDNANPYAPIIPGQRLDPRVAYVMTHLLKEVVQYGTAGRANSMGRSIAGKTGTTQDFRDGWFIGFSPRVVTGVWVGYDDQRTMGRGETGANTALPIWMSYMQNVLKDYPSDDFVVPEGISFVNIDSKTGKRSDGARAIKEAFITGTEPGFVRGPTTAEGGKAELPQTDDDTLREDD